MKWNYKACRHRIRLEKVANKTDTQKRHQVNDDDDDDDDAW